MRRIHLLSRSFRTYLVVTPHEKPPLLPCRMRGSFSVPSLRSIAGIRGVYRKRPGACAGPPSSFRPEAQSSLMGKQVLDPPSPRQPPPPSPMQPVPPSPTSWGQFLMSSIGSNCPFCHPNDDKGTLARDLHPEREPCIVPELLCTASSDPGPMAGRLRGS